MTRLIRGPWLELPSLFRNVFYILLLCLSGASSVRASALITRDLKPVHSGILSYTVTSNYQHQPNELEILLPRDYTPRQRYPVIYLLPVNTGTSGQWGSGIVEAQKADLQNIYRIIFVAPAYDTVPWFGDNVVDTKTRQNSYLTDVVVPFLDRHFSTIATPKGRGLVGFSKSGLGAWALFLMRPDLFGQVALFDSYEGQPSDLQWKTWGLAATYGTRENFDRYEPLTLLNREKERLRTEPCHITLLAGYPGSRVGVDTYRSKLQDYQIPYVYIQGYGMKHTWTSGWLPLAVAALATTLNHP